MVTTSAPTGGAGKAWFVVWSLPFGLEACHTDGTFFKLTRGVSLEFGQLPQRGNAYQLRATP